jgi:hypothetical protein
MSTEVRENYWDLVDKGRVREVIEAAIGRGYARGVADERARVVAWLLARAKTQKSWTGESTVAAALRAEADRIEREKP